jgi:hypothetical protein
MRPDLSAAARAASTTGWRSGSSAAPRPRIAPCSWRLPSTSTSPPVARTGPTARSWCTAPRATRSSSTPCTPSSACSTTAVQSAANSPYKEVDRILAAARSAWFATEDGLVHRADPTAQAAYGQAAGYGDGAGEELQKAWAHAYSRDSDASDAWDHAIKAVELIYIDIVCPTKDKANLGSVAGDLKAQPGRFTFGLQSTGIGGVETLEAMIRLMWPNPDRHGDPKARRTPTLQEARSVVNLAVTLVQWGRDGLLTRR